MNDKDKTDNELLNDLVQMRRQLLEFRKSETAREKIAAALRESEKRYRTLVDNALVGIYKSTIGGDLLFANKALLKMLEYDSLEEIAGNGGVGLRYKNPKDRETLIERLKKDGKVENFEFEAVTKSGKTKNILLSGTLEGETLLGMMLEITERKQLELELEKLATTDRLTQTYNRLKFEEIIRKEIEMARRYGHLLSLIILDIDHFKEVNDTYGHIAGDDVLKAVAGTARENIRETDSLVRWGGEEFIVIAPGTSLEGAAELAERIRKSVEDFDFGHLKTVRISLGVTQFREHDTENTLLRRADDAMYAAKNKGRNRVEVM
ncbi:MAG: sensor domain-containing diguanylate cyclase [Candidatus Sulfobium sp.]|jgi:diguanylate cyclase (GGDEF)-like protein/PAS domain S-box-containing protein